MESSRSRAARILEEEIAGVLLDGGAISPRAFARRLLRGPLGELLREPGLPAVASEAMRRHATDFALGVTLSSNYRWNDYMRDLWGVMAREALAEQKREDSRDN